MASGSNSTNVANTRATSKPALQPSNSRQIDICAKIAGKHFIPAYPLAERRVCRKTWYTLTADNLSPVQL
jgi:hypothetical protein